MLTQAQFDQLVAAGYNRIPLTRAVLADLETPLSTYLKLANQPYSYLLESVQGGEKWGRYSVIGLACRQRLEIRAKICQLFVDDAVVEQHTCDDPLDQVRQFHRRFVVPDLPELPRFSGGLVGFFGYATIGYIEATLAKNPIPDPLNAPDILLMASEELVVFDNLTNRLFIIVHVDATQPAAWCHGGQRLTELVTQLATRLTPRDPAPSALGATDAIADGSDVHEIPYESSFLRADYEAAVEKCKQYIFDGEAFQIVLSQRLSLPYEEKPLDLYRALRTVNPSPYLYYLHLGDLHIAGSSPEILVRLENNEITLRPIAGTRPRGKDAQHDAKLMAELLADPKELAEHLMLIDLGRNDVGRVAKTGTVTVTEQMSIEKYSHVMHIVSNISGELRAGLDALDLLKATFPAGTLSGAPKVRALQIIEQLEPDQRGIYSGAIGYLGWNGNMDTAIAIRTALIKEQRVYIQAGGGIVADSVPSLEWEETLNKGRAVLKAVAMVKAGLHHPLDAPTPRAPAERSPSTDESDQPKQSHPTQQARHVSDD